MVSAATIPHCSREEKICALERALHSETFHRCEKLKAFLRYICQTEIDPAAGPINEYAIAVAVLGRPASFSPAEDSSVRTRAYELRQKLAKLYSTELTLEPIEIHVPKGCYSPQYLRRSAVFAQPAQPPTWFDKKLVAALLLGLLLGVTLPFAIHQVRSAAQQPKPVLRQAWGPLLDREANVLVSTVSPLALVVGPWGHQVVDSPEYPAPPAAYSLFGPDRLSEAGDHLGLTFSNNLLGFGVMSAVLTCTRVLSDSGSRYQVLPDRIATISSLRGRNAILFGPPVDSATISFLMKDAPLTIDFEPAAKEFAVRNRLTGAVTLPDATSNELQTVYGLITVLGNRTMDGHRTQIVIFSGITSLGCQGAAEFFSSSGNLSLLQSKLKATAFPPSYQVAVKCTVRDLQLLSVHYFSHAILEPSSL